MAPLFLVKVHEKKYSIGEKTLAHTIFCKIGLLGLPFPASLLAIETA
jgi:hypothetical protein